MNITVGILTISDRCARGLRIDGSGPALRDEAGRRHWRVVESRTVPDEVSEIAEALRGWCDEAGVSLILTAGGTGLSPRDVTPEATRRILDKELPGFAELMRAKNSRTTPSAILSRAVAGARKGTLIINLPGSPQGAVDSLSAVADLIPHALEMLSGAGHPKTEAHHDLA